MPDERYDVEAVLRERSGAVPLPKVTWVGDDAYGSVYRVYAWSLAPEVRADMNALLLWLRYSPRRRWINNGRRRALRMLREFELAERMDAAQLRVRLRRARDAA
jgi:hypothetical protein